jgi:hypothetical protein
MDRYVTTGNPASTAVSRISAPAASTIKLSIPPITVVEHYYYFKLSAIADGGATEVSNNIKIRLVNCAYTVLSLPVPYSTPKNYFVLDVDVNTDLEYIFTQTTSDFALCRSITMK